MSFLLSLMCSDTEVKLPNLGVLRPHLYIAKYLPSLHASQSISSWSTAVLWETLAFRARSEMELLLRGSSEGKMDGSSHFGLCFPHPPLTLLLSMRLSTSCLSGNGYYHCPSWWGWGSWTNNARVGVVALSAIGDTYVHARKIGIQWFLFLNTGQ